MASSFAALPEPLSTQVKDLTNREEDAHKAGPHHEEGENFLLRGPKEYIVTDETENIDKDILIPLKR